MNIQLKIRRDDKTEWMLCDEDRGPEDNNSIAGKAFLSGDRFVEIYLRIDTYEVYCIVFAGLTSKRAKSLVSCYNIDAVALWERILAEDIVKEGVASTIRAHERGEI